jgi:hypothetical protein
VNKRVVHILFAFLILIQSVSALAVMPSMYEGHAESDAMSSMAMDASRQGSQVLCHDEIASPDTATPEKCCEMMDGASCNLNCSSVVSATACMLSLDSTDIHERYATQLKHAAPHHASAGLYRPPRIS